MSTVFLLLKFLHVAAVTVWIGGMFALAVINARLAGTADGATRAALGRQSERYGRTIIGPAMGIALLAGVGAAGSIGYPFSSLWIVWGIVGFVVSIFIGGVAVSRTGAELGEVSRTAGPTDPRAASLAQRLSMLNWVNLLILASVVYAMVFRPTI